MPLKIKQRDEIKARIMADPSVKNKDLALEYNCSLRTIANLRTEMVEAGTLLGGRRVALPTKIADVLKLDEGEPHSVSPTSSSERSTAAPLLTPADLMALSAESEDTDDENTRKLLLAKVRAIALDPDTHNDTAISAAQAFIKLKDAVKAKALGPGKPLSREGAVARLTNLLTAVGAAIAVAAFERAYGGLIATQADNGGLSSAPDTTNTEQQAAPAPIPSGSDAGMAPTSGLSGASDVGRPVPTDEN